MDAIHIRTGGFYCGACPKVVEKALGSLNGVSDVVSVRSMGLTSVLYDPETVSREDLCERIRRAGFKADLVARQTGDLHTEELQENEPVLD